MAKADELRETFLAEFGEAATQTRTGKLLGFEQHEPPETPTTVEPEE